nr:MAG TPA: hypothetical protein [Caudoviricetes sp.]
MRPYQFKWVIKKEVRPQGLLGTSFIVSFSMPVG